MKRLLKALCCITFLVSVFHANAQTPNHYLFRTDNKPYTEITNETVIQPANFGTGDIWDIPLTGETFNFFGKSYAIDGSTKKISFSNSGHMRVDDDTTLIILDGLFYFMDSIDLDTKLSYTIEGTTGNKIVKAQWKNLKVQSGQAGNFVNFQVWIYQATGIFEIHYGASSSNNQSGYTSSTGPNVGLFYAKTDFSKMLEKIWITGMPSGYIIDSARTVSFKGVTGVPLNGTVYRFIPKTVATNIETQETAKDFKILGNPVNNELRITGIKARTSFILRDMQGRIVAKRITNGEEDITISTTHIASGAYQLTIKAGNKQQQETILIQH